MNQQLNQPSLSEQGVTFTVVVDSVKRECLITPQALQKLSALGREDSEADMLEIFHAYEANISGVARRLVAAGVAGSPLVMSAETFNSPRTR
ncbi:MAG TPA: DUF1488 family protein [Noviherbaspirillum sp.]|uniref:DUF1488 family protein n=1 Tax=Noviherbaspirillum sp. TaxID=1926288 RepID=UPI002D65508A|nr:DUF1488 family protein [Noviherbaspirillum sp.]HYD95333.1 DUF1488 family protein [Noviherbaspirillum sp.]